MSSRQPSIVPWLLLAVTALIVYGSLYPFDFRASAVPGGLLQAVRELSWARAGRGDRISNVLLYLPLGFCLFLWLDRRTHARFAAVIAVLAGTGLSFCIEVAQAYVSKRVPSLTDLSLNSAGTVGGAVLGMAWGSLVNSMHLPARVEKPDRDPAAALLIALWLAWRLAPFTPLFDLGKLKAALQPLFRPQFEFAAVFVFLTFWLVVSQALERLVSRTRSVEALLLLIASVLVGRLLVAGQSFVPSELLALVLLLPLLVVMHRLTAEPKQMLLIASTALAFAIERLRPFDFTSTSGRFDFWPFLHWFTSDFPSTLLGIDWMGCFETLFLAASLYWVLRHGGAGYRLAAGVVFAAVMLTEIARLWLQSRSASITDPALTLAVLYALRYAVPARRLRLGTRAISRHARSP